MGKIVYDTLTEQCPNLAYVDIRCPRWDQNSFYGRFRHFFAITSPLHLLSDDCKLRKAGSIVDKVRRREKLDNCLTEDEVWNAKHLVDSAFHPETGEKINMFGRMAAQTPVNMVLLTGMLSQYQSTTGVIFWHWMYQSFNALVNYSNRNGIEDVNKTQFWASYVASTGTAIGTALALNKAAKKYPPIVGRFVPFVACCAAALVSVPFMRAQELKTGVTIFNQRGEKLGKSKVAAQEGVKQTVVSRILMIAPPLLISPLIMDYLERRGTLCRYPWIVWPLNFAIVGLTSLLAVPLTLALYKQMPEIYTSNLERQAKESLCDKFHGNVPYVVFYSRGL